MKNLHLLFIILPFLVSCGNTVSEEYNSSTQFVVKNTSDISRVDALIKIDPQEIAKENQAIDWNAVKFVTENTIPFQINDLDGDGVIEEVVLILDFNPNEEKTISIESLKNGEKLPSFRKRTYAEISHKVNGNWKDREYQGGEFKNVSYLEVPPEHTDHSWFIRYEGPGWESDLVGYRFYLDWRNATDIFGKKTNDIILQDVGQDGFDSYHEPADWGMDILKVGKSLGVGALGSWFDNQALRVETTDSITCRIALNGNLQSMIQTKYYGWKVGEVSTDVTSELSIHGGSRLTRHDVSLSQSLPNLCTGIVKHDNSVFFKNTDSSWGYIATWGKQSLAEDHLGMAILFKTNDLIEITEDNHSNVVVLNPINNELTYYFLAAWEQEPGGIKTQEAFIKYLETEINELNMPLVLEY